jgi:hypothetical protein
MPHVLIYCAAMSAENKSPGPRFEAGDSVKIVGFLTAHRGRQGVIAEVRPPAADLVYRYQVNFADDVSDTFYGFELQKVQPQE